jgi:3-hydroxyacyl-CoA dehydrogenase
MRYSIHQTVVIGSGTMGAAIAAHLANAGMRVTLLDIVPQGLTPEEEKKGLTPADPAVRSRIVQQGLDRALKSRPASFFSSDTAALVKTGNIEDDLGVVAKADWVIEVIVENLEAKRALMEKIDALRGEHTIVTTNTSGIPVASIAEGRSEGFRQHFLGTHFFNPPRYLKLLEVIPTPETLPEVIEAVRHTAEYSLGKGVVIAKDTPNFIANRLGFGGGAFGLDYILENGYTVEEVDAITGPLMGRPKTATFRLIDLVGIDIWQHVGKNLAPAIPQDEMAQRYLKSERANGLIGKMVERGWLGNKSKQGFYKEMRQPDGKKEFWALNLETQDYEAPKKVRFDSIGRARNIEKLDERMKLMLSADDRAAQLVKALTYQGLAYASACIPEVSDSVKPVDDAMRWGFGHEAGPFETWDLLGVQETADCMEQIGFPAAGWVREMLSSGFKTFYQYEGDKKAAAYNAELKEYEPISRDPLLFTIKEKKEAGKVIAANPGAHLVDLGDGIAAVEFHTKLNTLDTDTFAMIQQGLDALDTDFNGLVIGNDAEHFSAGANLFMVVMAAQGGMWEQLDQSIRLMQDLNMRIRYSPKPVVIAPAGMSLGGGAEITMYGSRVVAASELYTGLVEMGAGVIPAGGGTKEMLRRLLNPPMRTPNADALPFLQRIFEQIGLAKVSTSAEEARGLGILGAQDRIVMNRDHLLAEAKREALHMAQSGYRPPIPEKIYAAGRDGLAAMRVGIFTFKEAQQITEYESHIAGKLAYVMTGGEFSRPAWVDEQYILDLEREAFLSLCGEVKTQERMWNLLQTGKPLRN